MLSEETKKQISDSSALMAELNEITGSVEGLPEHIAYAVEIGKPIYVLRKRGYTDLDYLLNGANIVGGLEYDGEANSEEYLEAHERLIDVAKYHLGDDGLERLIIAGYDEAEVVDVYIPQNYEETGEIIIVYGDSYNLPTKDIKFSDN